LPDVMAKSGARLREVGTANRTHPDDYRRALGPATALLLKVHPSNYRLVGYTAAVELATLVAIGREGGVPVVEDLGSGALVDLAALGLPHEPVVRDRIAAGADLVTFSGDKLLGGPQAGIVGGRRGLLDRLAENPLPRGPAPGARPHSRGPLPPRSPRHLRASRARRRPRLTCRSSSARRGTSTTARRRSSVPSRGRTPTVSRRRKSAASRSTSASRSSMRRVGSEPESSTCPGTSASSVTCWPVPTAWTSSSSPWPPTTASCRRPKSTWTSSTSSACGVASS